VSINMTDYTKTALPRLELIRIEAKRWGSWSGSEMSAWSPWGPG
jgi:glutamate formiminotransferase